MMRENERRGLGMIETYFDNFCTQHTHVRKDKQLLVRRANTTYKDVLACIRELLFGRSLLLKKMNGFLMVGPEKTPFLSFFFLEMREPRCGDCSLS